MFDATLSDLFTVQEEHRQASFSQAATIVIEFHPYLVLARWNLLLTFDIVVLHPVKIVAILGFTIFGIQTPATRNTALGNNDAFCFAFWYNYLGSDRE